MSELLLIRADANPQIGTGHVMRCLALAQAWQQSGDQALFAMALPAGPVQERLKSEGIEVVELPATVGGAEDPAAIVALSHERNAQWVVLDGYHFDAGYQRRLKEAGLRLLVVDDCGHAKHYYADFVLNQNPGALPSLYPNREAHTRLLLGQRYVMLRQEFLKWRDWQPRLHETGRKVLVTLGGSDADNVTFRMIEALCRLQDCEATVVVGANNPHWEELQSSILHHAPRIKLVRNPAHMPQLMAEADLAIAAGGTTAWELAFMGLPALLVALADNQVSNVKQLDEAGVARSLGRPGTLSDGQIAGAADALLKDAAARAEMSRRGRALIDGEGSFRVWQHLKEPSLLLRQVTDEDCRLLWQWANDPVVRAMSFSPEPIPWEDHVQWFAAKQQEMDCPFWIACDRSGQPVGQVRFDAKASPAIISISLGRKHRGRNLGSLVIWLACRKLFREMAIDTVHACIKKDNEASVRAFLKAGFEQAAVKEVNGHAALVFHLSKDHVEP